MTTDHELFEGKHLAVMGLGFLQKDSQGDYTCSETAHKAAWFKYGFQAARALAAQEKAEILRRLEKVPSPFNDSYITRQAAISIIRETMEGE